MTKKIIVLMGGWSNEREVSLTTGKSIAKELKEQGYAVSELDVTRDINAFVDAIQTVKPDVVFNALHGTGGEDGVIQGVLDMMQIPYTHSGVTASAVAMDKILSRLIFIQEGIPVPEYNVLSLNDYKNGAHPFAFPYVIKPLNEGSSRGVSIIREDADRSKAMAAWTFGDHVIVEVYIPGREISVAVVDGKAIGTVETCANEAFKDRGFRDYELKYTAGCETHLVPAPVDATTEDLLCDYTERAHKVLGCKGVTRADFRLDTGVTPHRIALLELNTQPGFTAVSLVPAIAKHKGISFGVLLSTMIEHATCAS
ncbi:MAG: D-alanine--D-alanine ligase [Pseudomonadota bacterium]|nr:D-alanine--D-alanine ligase [Alphaproteobacteria bacterium]MDP5370290.1 D-alanine--D-alanine ligase [Pseudomonadota bacterium]